MQHGGGKRRQHGATRHAQHNRQQHTESGHNQGAPNDTDPLPAGAQRQQQHTPAHPTAQDKQTDPASHNRYTTEEKNREAEKKTNKQNAAKKEQRKSRRNKNEAGGVAKKKKKKTKGGGAGGQQNARPKTLRAGNHGTPETKGAHKRKKKNKTQQQPQTGQPEPGGGLKKKKDKAATRKGEAQQNAPGRPARPTRPRGARTRTHAGDPGLASSDPKEAVSASTRDSPGAPAKSPVEIRAVRETGRVSDRVQTRKHRGVRTPRPTPEGPAINNPIAGTQTGTTRSQLSAAACAAASGRHKEPGSRPGWRKAPQRQES